MNLIQLLQSNLKSPRQFQIKNENNKESTLYLYDIIGADWYGGVSALEIAKQLDALDIDILHLRINSPGGDVFEARAIAQSLKNHKAKVIAHIDGYAASAATYIALAADEVEIAEGGFFMIHNAWTLSIGNAGDMRKTAALLDKIDASIHADYRQKTGADEQQISQWMDEETWFTAEEALQHGFVDRIAKGSKAKQNTWNLSAYTHAPSALTQPPEPEINEQEHRAHLMRNLELLERQGH